MEKANLIDKLSGRLADAAQRALATVRRLAQQHGLPLYLVGGPVRDLILGADTLDLDLVVEGDAPALARWTAAELGARCVQHAAFLTASVGAQDFALDLATARTETYEHPGALPRVHPASIQDDLRRRDFSFNALALALTGPHRGELLDPCGGRADMEAGLVRVLHEGSFVDDATRILRAVRYELRFGFRMEERALSWLRRDVGYLETISGARIRQEFSRIFDERQPERALLRLQELGALAQVHPSLSFGTARARAFASLRRLAPESTPAGCWPLLAWGLNEGQAAALAGRLALTKPQSQAVSAAPPLRRLERALSAAGLKPSAVVEMLSPYPAAAVWALAAAAGDNTVGERCGAYLRRWRYVKGFLNGTALLTLGVPAGARVGEVLRRLKVAKLDGEVKSRRDEERLVRSLLSGGGQGAR